MRLLLLLYGSYLNVRLGLGPKADYETTFACADACRDVVMVCPCIYAAIREVGACRSQIIAEHVTNSPGLCAAGMAGAACSRLTLRPGWHFCMHTTSSTLTSAPGAPCFTTALLSGNNLPGEPATRSYHRMVPKAHQAVFCNCVWHCFYEIMV